MPGMVSTKRVCQVAGITYRQLDYWIRNAVVSPTVGANGSGTRRAFTLHEVRIVRLVADLNRLGAGSDALRKAAMFAELLSPREWTGHAYVDATGELTLAPHGSCYVVDLGACTDHERPLVEV